MRLAMLLLRLLQCLPSVCSLLPHHLMSIRTVRQVAWKEEAWEAASLIDHLSVAGGLFASFPEYILKWRLESAKHRDFPHGFQLFWKLQQLLGL